MPLNFGIIETTMNPLWDFGWFDLTRFSFEGQLNICQNYSDILAKFLQDPLSQCSFCSRGPWGEALDHHGPFLHAKLNADWYKPISLAELAERIHMALDDPQFTEPPSREQQTPIETWIAEATERGDAAFVLNKST